MDEEIILHKRLDRLKSLHQALDDQIDAPNQSPFRNEFEVSRLKRERLKLNDEISYVQSLIYPDIIA